MKNTAKRALIVAVVLVPFVGFWATAQTAQQRGGRGGARGAGGGAAAGPVRRAADGKPDLTGMYLANAGGANYGLEQNRSDFLTPGTQGVIVDPPDRKLPYQDWARAERIERELPERGYDD